MGENMNSQRSKRHPSPAMAVALLALFVALGGSAVAGIELTRNSVGNEQIRAGSVTTTKLRNGAVTGAKVANGSLSGADVTGPVTSAGSASIAGSANTVNCPGGTLPTIGLCAESGLRAPLALADALKACGDVNRRLPTIDELVALAAAGTDLGDPELSGEVSSGSPITGQTVVYADGTTVAGESSKNLRAFRCVTLPVG
jgi:hypothetical protein